MGGACGTFWGKRRCTCRILMGKLEGKRSLGRPRRRLVGICVTDFTILHFVFPGSEGYDSNDYYYYYYHHHYHHHNHGAQN
jgi:hypothetical protein